MISNSERTQRLFFALWPNAAQRDALIAASAAARAAAQAAGGALVPPENLHVTLAFVGAVPAERVREVAASMTGVRARRVRLVLDRLEHWQQPRVLCAVSDPQAREVAGAEVAAVVRRACAARRILTDVKPFRPHVTLARQVSRVSGAREMQSVALDFDRVTLVASRPGVTASIYSVVDSWPLYDD